MPRFTRTRDVALFALVAGLCLLVSELTVRAILPAAGFRPYPAEAIAGLIVPLPTRGYGYTPGFEGAIESGGVHLDLSINDLGFRDQPLRPNETVDVLAVGDSFTAGFGVDVEEAWPEQLEQQLQRRLSERGAPVRVLNAGVSGYSIVHIGATIDELLSLEPRVVVLGLFTDVYTRIDDPPTYYRGFAAWRSEIPHLRPVEDGLLYSPFDNRALREVHYWTIEHFQFAAHALRAARNASARFAGWRHPAPTAPVAERIKKLLAELERIARRLAERRLPLVVLLVNRQAADGRFSDLEREYNRVVGAFCAERGIEVVDPLPRLITAANGRPMMRLEHDYHWSPEAHRIAAAAVADFLVARRLLVEDSDYDGARATGPGRAPPATTDRQRLAP